MLFDRGVGDELGVIRASDSMYEIIGGREKFFNSPYTFNNAVNKEDLDRFWAMFDQTNDYHTMGKCICRLEFPGRTIWADFKIRLLEKYVDHRVFFAVVDDITDAMEAVVGTR